MGNYQSNLIGKIRHHRLDEKNPSQTKTGTDWKQVLAMAEYGLLSEGMAKIYLHTIETDIEFFTDFPDFLHRLPGPELLYADGRPHVRLGSLIGGDTDLEFGIRFEGPLFILCAGLIGFGKTTAIRVLLKGIHEYNLRNPGKKVVVIVFDRKGGDYADLAAMFGWKHYHVYNSLRQALENPDGIPAQVWVGIITDLFRARAELKFSQVTMAKAIRILLGLLNVEPSQRLIWPDLQLILDFLKALPETTFSTKAEYVRSLKQQLEGITQSPFNTFRAFQGFRVEDLIAAGQSAIIQMPNMNPGWARQFLVDTDISRVLKSRIECSHRVDSTEVLFVVDEADDDVNANVESLFSESMSPISECFKKGREFGIGVCLSVSSLRSVSQLIRENATTHLMFRCSDSRARAEAAATLMLPPYGELTLDHLEKGQCLIKQIGPWPHAMKGQIDYMPPSRVHVTKYDTHPFIPPKRLWEIPSVKQFVDSRNEARKKTGKDKTDTQPPHHQIAMKLLQLRAANPYAPVARIFEAIGDIDRKLQKTVRDFIEEKHYAEFEEVRIGRSNVLLTEITTEGYKAVGLPEPGGNKGRGGITHCHFAHWIKFHFEKKGCKAYLEKVLTGTSHPVDVAVQLDNKCNVFEICITARDNLASHLEACFEKSTETVESLTIIAATKNELKKIEETLRLNMFTMQYAGKIKFDVIENYIIRELKNESN